ncbi:MAG TPA: HPr-rel-A system PqqD family peptide chaperone [Actinomycetota bacterium]
MAASRPQVRGDLVVVELDGEAVVYDERSGELHHLNPSATLIFGLLDGSATIRTLADDMSQAFGVPQEEMESQVRALVGQLRRLGLIEGKAEVG